MLDEQADLGKRTYSSTVSREQHEALRAPVRPVPYSHRERQLPGAESRETTPSIWTNHQRH